MNAPIAAPELVELRAEPPRAGRLAAQAREAKSGRNVVIIDRATEADPAECAAAVAHADGTVERCTSWPSPDTLHPDDRLTVRVNPDQAEAFVAYLERLTAATSRPASIAPWCPAPEGTHRLWAIAAARIALPEDVRVEARHDLLGTRMAQLALAFGADALGGPVEGDRKLPLAGVSRPTETTRTGLSALVEQAGLVPVWSPQ